MAVDLGPYAQPLVHYGCNLARDLDAELILTSVIDQRVMEAFKSILNKKMDWSAETLLKDREHQLAEKLLELLEREYCESVAHRIAVRTGVPFKAILSVIDEEAPDLLIIGAKGRTNLKDVVVGSCAEKLFRRSPIPILTLPANYETL